MLFTAIASILLAGTVVAQSTPDGFTPSVGPTLDVYYGTQYITPGLMVKKSSVSKQPVIGTKDTLNGTKYLLAMVDVDAPPQGSGTTRGQVLHALLQDFAPSGQTQNGTNVLTTKATGPASYFGPAPPAETPKHPHKYIFLLYDQPADFAVPADQKSAVSQRVGIDWSKFAASAKLPAPKAANWLQVQSGDNTRIL